MAGLPKSGTSPRRLEGDGDQEGLGFSLRAPGLSTRRVRRPGPRRPHARPRHSDSIGGSLWIDRPAALCPLTFCLPYLVGMVRRRGHGALNMVVAGVKVARLEGAGMGWTDERVELLKKLWLEGLSASQIAKQLGGVTRNAVIGKVHRLGLSGRAAPSQPSRPTFKAPRAPRPAPAPAPRRVAEHHAAPAPVPVLYPEEPGSATVLTLGAHMCKWPIGDP